MSRVTHALTMNGHLHGELKDRLDAPAAIVRKRLALLDGIDRYSLMLWKLPSDVFLDDVNLKMWPQEYIQAAGNRDLMTVEARRLEKGVPRHYVVGHRKQSDDDSGESVEIPWNQHTVTVQASETFTAAEAAELFFAYYQTGWVPAAYTLRGLDLK
jgi:hypothetical protein